VYEPRAIVRHRHRRTEAELHRQLLGHQLAFIALIVKTIREERGRARMGTVLFLAWRLAKAGRHMLHGIIGNGPLPRGLFVKLFIASFLGLGSYQASKRRNCRQIQIHGGGTPKFVYQLSELWRYRELIWIMAVRDLKVKYQRSWFGFLWTLMNPLITLGVLVAVFSYVVRLPISHYWAFLISGYFAWNFFSQTLNGGMQSAVGNAYLSRSAYFPQEALVISAALARLIEFIGEIAIVMIFLTIFHHHGVPLSYIIVIPLIIVLFFLVLGISFFVVTFAIYYNDAVPAVSLATMALFYVSPVFYNINLVPEEIRIIYFVNPMALLLLLFHDVLYWGIVPDFVSILIASMISLAFVLAGYTVFNRKKREFAEVI
jgi:ABC-type polysaccharide/polyol phosphate export permease